MYSKDIRQIRQYHQCLVGRNIVVICVSLFPYHSWLGLDDRDPALRVETPSEFKHEPGNKTTPRCRPSSVCIRIH